MCQGVLAIPAAEFRAARPRAGPALSEPDRGTLSEGDQPPPPVVFGQGENHPLPVPPARARRQRLRPPVPRGPGARVLRDHPPRDNLFGPREWGCHGVRRARADG